MATPKLLIIAMAIAAFAPAAGAIADSTQASPPSAQKEGGIEGDSRGAIRTLNDSDPKEKHRGTATIVPDLGGERTAPIRKVPEGTAGFGTAR